MLTLPWPNGGRLWRKTAMFFSCFLVSLWVSSAPVVGEVSIQEWLVPWEDTRPRDPWVHDGRLWFVGQRGDYVAVFDPAAESFQRFPLPPGTGPHTVIVDDRGAWYAGNLAAHIGLLDPASGDIRKLPLPGDGRRDSHTLDFTDDGNIWFSVQGGNQIGFLDTDSGDMTLYNVPTANARPYGLVFANGDVWATLFGIHKLATIKDGKVLEIDLPRKQARPRRLAVTADGLVWYVDYAEGYIGRYDPEDGSIREWRTPAAENSRPYAMAADSEGRLWFVETGITPNRVVGFVPESETFTEPKVIPSGGGTVRHMFYDSQTNSIWFGADTNTIGRIKLAQ